MSSGKKTITRHTDHGSPFKSTPNKVNRLRSKSTKTLRPQTPSADTSNLSKSREKLSESLNTYTLLIRSSNPIRCLQHNSNISIYCETQQKLLCANCIFGRTQHKFHRVTPIDKSLDKIEKDVDTMNRLIERQIIKIQAVAQKLRDNLIQQEQDTHNGLSSLISVYEQCHRLLEQSFLRSKERIIDRFQKTRSKYEHLMFQLSQLNQDYGVSGILKSIQRDYFKKEDILLYEHAICSTISKQKRFQEKDWIHDKKEVDAVVSEEGKKITVILEMLTRMRPKQ